MTSLRNLIEKTLSLPLSSLTILLLLGFTCFVKSIGLSLYDIGITTLLLEKVGTLSLAFNLICAAFLLAIGGYYAILFDRRQSYGSLPILSFLILIIGLGMMLFSTHAEGVLNTLFPIKYTLYVLFTTAFWSMAVRFIPLRFDSLKFSAIFLCELLGFTTGGFIGLAHFQTDILLVYALAFLILSTLSLLLLNYLNPIANETFVKKQGGAQGALGKKLIRFICLTAFVFMVLKSAMDIGFYTLLSLQTTDYSSYLSLFWLAFGGIGLITVILLRQSHYLYTTTLGLTLLISAAVGSAVSLFIINLPALFLGYTLFHLTAYFYIDAYFKILPRPIALAHKIRLKKLRLLIIEPAGFMLSAIFFFFFESPFLIAAYLGLFSFFFALLILKTNQIYSTILLRSFKTRFWRGSPLMISTSKLLPYVLEQLKSNNTDDVIYFLRVLQESRHPQYKKYLLKSLKHPNPQIRRFVLLRMERLENASQWQKSLENTLQKDPDKQVRQTALRVLIQWAGNTQNHKQLEKLTAYLDDKNLKPGALIGFLKLGGTYTLLAMDGLQKLVFSKKKNDQLLALFIMSAAPNPGYARLLTHLSQSSDTDVLNQTLLTAGLVRHPQTLSFIFRALDQFELKEAALTALKNYGKGAFPMLEKMLNQTDIPAQRLHTLILFLGALNSGEGKQLLLRSLNIPNQKLRKTILTTLFNNGIIWVQSARKKVLKKSIKKDISRIQFWIRFLELFGTPPTHETEEAFKYLRQGIEEDIADTRLLILYQLLLLKPHPLFYQSVQILKGADYALYPTALGVIQDFLPHRLYQKIKPLILYPTHPIKSAEVQYHSIPQITQSIGALITQPAFIMPPWIQANALYCLRRLGDAHGLPAVKTALKKTDPMILEAAIYALGRLEPNAEKRHALLLDIPTAALTHQNLELMLK